MMTQVLRVLLVEDDAISAAFLQGAVEALPAQVDSAPTLAAAWSLAQQTAYDLWLIDANLPDGSGADLLLRLREAGLQAIALAHTADTQAAAHEALLAAGFAEVIIKPVQAAQLRERVRQHCGNLARPPAANQIHSREATDHNALPIWDDATALLALGGEIKHVHGLRELFLNELDQQCQAVLHGSRAQRRETLHRMAASCGFVGALRLQACVKALLADSEDAQLLSGFAHVAEATKQDAQGRV